MPSFSVTGLTKKIRMKPETSHPDNEKFVLQTQFPLICSIARRLQNFQNKMVVEKILSESPAFLLADQIGRVAGSTATGIVPHTPAGRQACCIFAGTFAVICVGWRLQALLLREVY
jgi:hypothetical protein